MSATLAFMRKAAVKRALRQLTRDDSFIRLLAAAPGAEPAALAAHPMRHLLTSVLGPRSEIAVDVEEMTLSDGELLLMTTDGMHGGVGDDVMDAILDGHERGTDLEVAAEHLRGSGTRRRAAAITSRWRLPDTRRTETEGTPSPERLSAVDSPSCAGRQLSPADCRNFRAPPPENPHRRLGTRSAVWRNTPIAEVPGHSWSIRRHESLAR